jgi:CHASE3 domain sensor protein
MLRTLKTVVVMIFFLFSAVFVFSVIGVAVFGDIQGYSSGTTVEAETFETLPHAVVLMYSMLTTEGYPVFILVVAHHQIDYQ